MITDYSFFNVVFTLHSVLSGSFSLLLNNKQCALPVSFASRWNMFFSILPVILAGGFDGYCYGFWLRRLLLWFFLSQHELRYQHISWF